MELHEGKHYAFSKPSGFRCGKCCKAEVSYNYFFHDLLAWHIVMLSPILGDQNVLLWSFCL